MEEIALITGIPLREPFINFRPSRNPDVTFNTTIKRFIQNSGKKYYKIFYNEELNQIEFILTDDSKDNNIYSPSYWNLDPIPYGISSVNLRSKLLRFNFKFGRIPVIIVEEENKFICKP